MEGTRFEFEGYTLWPERRLLEIDSRAVRLGSREFDILLALIESGDVLSQDELLAKVWPRENVGEAIVRVRVALLRKALGGRAGAGKLIATIAGEGYAFVGDVTRKSAAAIPSEKLQSIAPVPLSPIIGRDDDLREVQRLIERHRWVTVVGPGGVGKSRLALEVSRRLLERFDLVAFVEVERVTSFQTLLAELGRSLCLEVSDEHLETNIRRLLNEHNALIVFDTCEHASEAVASVLTKLQGPASRPTVICTSRVPIGIEGETVFRLRPLDFPAKGEKPADGKRVHAAVQLLAERATAIAGSSRSGNMNSEHVYELCRRLEGIPLAIEFAASRVPEFGVAGVLARIDQPFEILDKGRRTATQRHRSLRETLAWSYRLLEPDERSAFRALSCFSEGFCRRSAAAVMGTPKQAGGILLDRLVAKSLVTEKASEGFTSYRMLNMTRDYAREMVIEEQEQESIARMHVLDVMRLLIEAEDTPAGDPAEQGMRLLKYRVEDFRQALDWSFSDDGDIRLGIEIVARASIVFLPADLMDEFMDWLERAIAANAVLPREQRSADERLLACRGAIMRHSRESASRI